MLTTKCYYIETSLTITYWQTLLRYLFFFFKYSDRMRGDMMEFPTTFQAYSRFNIFRQSWAFGDGHVGGGGDRC